MKTSIFGALLIYISMCVSAYAVTDSTSFDPTAVAVEAKGAGGVPVGTIVAWPVEQNPADWDMWLECNGQAVDASVYPELIAFLFRPTPLMPFCRPPACFMSEGTFFLLENAL